MKKTLLFFAAIFGTVGCIKAQTPLENRLDIADATRAVLSMELNYPSKTVSDALDQYLKDDKQKTKSSKGFTVMEGAKFLDVAPELMDYYFKIDSKDKSKAIMYLGVSKGNLNFVTPENDAKVWENAKQFMIRFAKYVDQYQLSLDISAQEKVVKDAEKALEKSVKEGEDLAKKLEENKKDQEAKKADLAKQQELLKALQAKKK